MKYLINRTDAIGDNILTMPMAQAIKELDPNATVAIITSAESEVLYKDHPYVDMVFTIAQRSSYFIKLKKSFNIFKTFMPEVYFYVGGTQTPNFVAWLKKVPFRGGILSRWQTFFTLNRGTRQRRSEVEGSEVFYNIELLRELKGFDQIESKTYLPKFNYIKSENDLLEFSKDIEDQGLETSKKTIVIQLEKVDDFLNLPAANYCSIISRIEAIYPNQYNFILTYSRKGLSRVQEEMKAYTGNNIFYINKRKKGLTNFINILANSSLIIGPNTGTLHIAASLKIPLIGIYPPIQAQSSLRWRPIGEGAIYTVTPNVVCGETHKCAGMECPYFDCMAKVEEDRIIELIKSILNK